MIYHFIDGLEDQTGVTKEELGTSCQWRFVQFKNINQELTRKGIVFIYGQSHEVILFMTGYLTLREGNRMETRYDLAIPNQEIRNIINTEHILQMFQKNVKNDGTDGPFIVHLHYKEAEMLNRSETLFTEYMGQTIKYQRHFCLQHSSGKKTLIKGILLGILSYKSTDWIVEKIQPGESGKGDSSDITIRSQILAQELLLK